MFLASLFTVACMSRDGSFVYTQAHTHIVWSSCSSVRQEWLELKVSANLYVHEYLKFHGSCRPQYIVQ